MELICSINCIKIILNYPSHHPWHSPTISQTPEKRTQGQTPLPLRGCRDRLLYLWWVRKGTIVGKNLKKDWAGQILKETVGRTVVTVCGFFLINNINNSNPLVPESVVQFCLIITSRQMLTFHWCNSAVTPAGFRCKAKKLVKKVVSGKVRC